MSCQGKFKDIIFLVYLFKVYVIYQGGHFLKTFLSCHVKGNLRILFSTILAYHPKIIQILWPLFKDIFVMSCQGKFKNIIFLVHLFKVYVVSTKVAIFSSNFCHVLLPYQIFFALAWLWLYVWVIQIEALSLPVTQKIKK